MRLLIQIPRCACASAICQAAWAVTARFACTAQARQNNPRWVPAQACQRLPQPWDEVLAAHARCLAEMQAGQNVEAYAAVLPAVQPLIKAQTPPPPPPSPRPVSASAAI